MMAQPARLLADNVGAPRWLPLWRVLLMLQVALAAIAGWMLPHGFPWTHPRFAANAIFPPLLAAVCLVGMWAAWKKKYRLLALVVLSVLFLWTACLMAALVVFPVSGRGLRLAGPLAIMSLGLAYRVCYGHIGFPPRTAIAFLCAAIAMGIMLPLTQRAPEPRTQPLNEPMLEAHGGSPLTGSALLSIDPQTTVNAAIHEVDYQGDLRVQLQPLVTFESCSPDRCWTVLASRAARAGPRRRLDTFLEIDGGYELSYRGDAPGLLRVRRTGHDVAVEAFTHLEQQIYSHLNSYTEILISRHRRLELAFSPCPDARIEVVPADYPVGRPMRLAYVDAARRFRVVESSSGEKGPFRELASGQLLPSQPLVITCYDAGEPRCRLELADWSAQLSTDLSPTAGWGVTQNAIEFRLSGNQPTSTAAIWFSLAGTSVGRGWDSVGHAPGVYRNRLRIEPIPRENPPAPQ